MLALSQLGICALCLEAQRLSCHDLWMAPTFPDKFAAAKDLFLRRAIRITVNVLTLNYYYGVKAEFLSWLVGFDASG